MASAVAELYAPLIERDLPAIPRAIDEFRSSHSADELFIAVARFAVLAFAPAQHAKHAFLAVAAAHDLRSDAGKQWDALLAQCAVYLAQSRLPWSEPPILDPPALEAGQRADLEELHLAIASRDRLRGERWLAARLDDPELCRDLIAVASSDSEDLGHKLIITVAAWKLSTLLGEKGRFAALRVAIWEMISYSGSEPVPRHQDLYALIERCVAEQGSLESAHALFLFDAMAEGEALTRPLGAPSAAAVGEGSEVPVYRLARDYAACLKAHAVRKRLRARFPDAPLDDFVAACHYNLEHAPSFEDWSFA
jgi:hypothetical protein